MPTVYGAFRTDTTLTTGQVQFGGVGSTFQISAYSSLTFDGGADPSVIAGDGTTNERPDDPTQTYMGEAIAWDYNYIVTDGTNTYTIGVFDYDIGGNSRFNGGAEQGYFIGFIGSVPPLDTVLTITGLGEGAYNHPVTSLPLTDFVPCFTDGTSLLTSSGARLVEDLKPGDQLYCYDQADGVSNFSALLRVFHRRLSADALSANAKLRPVRIMAGALGNGLPKRDLLVSRQHRMLVQSKIAKRMFGRFEVLVPAVKLTELPGIFVDESIEEVEYFHLLFEQHQVVYAEGAPTESLFTGPEAMKAISPEAREEILTIFPEIAELNYVPKPARFIPPGKLQKQLIARHAKNNKPLLGAV